MVIRLPSGLSFTPRGVVPDKAGLANSRSSVNGFWGTAGTGIPPAWAKAAAGVIMARRPATRRA